MRIAILDYGMGNLRSVEKALERVGVEVDRTTDADRAREAGGLVLPGVGAFPKAMSKVRELGFDALVAERSSKVPVLGICLGMQLLFDSSDEHEGATGLGLLTMAGLGVCLWWARRRQQQHSPARTKATPR